MADDIFKIDFYFHRWLADTSRLPPDVRGNYIQICMMIYANGRPIENDPKWISNLCNCSARLVRNHVDYLVENNFLMITSDGKIAQKRAELELNMKRTHLERSSNGGRTSSENKRKSKETNNLASTGSDFPVGSPSPPLPSPTNNSNNKHPTPDPREGSFKTSFSGGGVFRIDDFLTDDDRMAARLAGPGWDLYHLCRVYDDGINDGRRAKPKHPAQAFIAWVPLYTKGKKP